MRKIVFIGGGSAKFVRELSVDLFSYPELQDTHICLMDVDRERVDRSEKIVGKIIADRNLPGRVSSTLDRESALEGADFVVITIMVGGLKHYNSDSQIPAKYGVLQAVGDTIGAGGVFRYLRTAPVLQGIVNDLKKLSPRAWILNYANPMAMNTWTLLQAGHERTVGLCHSIQHCLNDISRWLDVPKHEIRYTAGGINHVDFYLTLQHIPTGENLYPKLLAATERVLKDQPHERSRFELLKFLGHFPAEGSWHQSEYYPWFRKDQKRIDHYGVESFWGYTVDSQHFKHRVEEIEQQLANKVPISFERSSEYGAGIVHSLVTGTLRKFYGNVKNTGGLIENLPAQALVEVPCAVDETGITAGRVGRIPPQLAAVMMPHVNVHEMAVQAAMTKDKRLVRQAIQADPLAGMILTLPEIQMMTDELFAENHEYLSDFQ
jgi:alpha-galactosidase